MSNTYTRNANGECPYCNDTVWDHTKTEERRPQQDIMYCQTCDKWSLRTRRGGQYPLRDPSDKDSFASLVARV